MIFYFKKKDNPDICAKTDLVTIIQYISQYICLEQVNELVYGKLSFIGKLF